MHQYSLRWHVLNFHGNQATGARRVPRPSDWRRLVAAGQVLHPNDSRRRNLPFVVL
nr:hypothetical protein [uncultured bacterium]